MRKILSLVLCLVALANAKKSKFHVAQTDPVDQSKEPMSFDELRKLVSTESQKEIGGEKIQDEKEVVVISPRQSLRLFLRNPSNETEEIRFTDLLPHNSLVMDFCIRNRGFFSSEEKETLSAAEEHFLGVDNPEKRSKIILGQLHKDATQDNFRWLDDDEMDLLPETEQDWRDEVTQRLGMLVQVAPADVFSVHITFREVIPPEIDATKDMYMTHMTVHIGQKANGVEGFLESPNYPFNYPDNADMHWLIRVPPNRHFGVNIVITELETEGCCDKIFIYDGIETYAPVLGVVSGNLTEQTPNSYTSTGADVLIEFKSDCLINEGYFSFYFTSINYPLEPACGTGEVLESSEGYIISANYPTDYPEIAHCTWTVVGPRGTYVDLEIIDFNLDQRDTVRVYDVYEDDSVPIADLTGNIEAHTHIVGHSEVMYLVFDSANHIIPRRGFNLHYAALDVPTACTTGLVYDDDEGELTSENYPLDYEANSHCTWQIRVDEGDVIFLDITDFETEEMYDILYIYDGEDSSARLIAGISGDKGLDRGYMTSSNSAYLVFDTDYAVNDGGFRVTWKGYTTSTQCIGSRIGVSGDVGYVSTPDYPSPYPSDSDCRWIIQTEESTVVQLHLFDIDLDIENDNYVVIYDGPSMDDRVLFNDSHLPRFEPLDINATQNQVHIMVETSDNFEERGVLIEWSQYNLTEECSRTTELNGAQGTFTSPLYPGNYAPGYTCSYHIRTPIRTRVQLLKKEFELGGKDTLRGYDGDNDKDPLLFECSRETCDLKPAKRNQMFLVFSAESSSTGFSFNYYGSSNSCVSSKHIEGELTMGSITSVGFPTNYEADAFCEWSIVGLPREIIKFTIEYLYTEACCDYLRIYDGSNSSDADEIAALSGIHYNEVVQTTDNRAAVTFSSDYSVNYPGFTLTYEGYRPKDEYESGSGSGEAPTCTGYTEMTQNEDETRGYVVPPGYVNDYPNDLDYCWYISFPEIYRAIELVFHRVELEEFYDYVLVYEGEKNDDSDPTELTGTIAYAEIQVPDSSTTILFHTDESVTMKGFILEYNALEEFVPFP